MWYKYKKYIEENEEIRCWFKVSSNRKKVRNIQLGLLEELKRICKKHNLKYYAEWWTLLWAIRHKWFIPWDDDVDLVMFREDYEKLFKIAPKELPNWVKLFRHHQWFSKIVNINTTALWYENRWDKDFVGWIWIDIFPMDYASRFMIINHIKSIILRFLRMILLSKKSDAFVTKMKKWQQVLINICNHIFKKIDSYKICQIHERISKKTFFKWDYIYTGFCPYIFYPKRIFDKYYDIQYENTCITIPNWYDTYLRITYGDYMKPVIYNELHGCRFSVNKSYKDIIKTFDKFKTNEENYKNCWFLFLL